mmetsp:Transcript_7980/g.17777  ORF Transcript_7980/g.17777 Transcript_7980/m.17777 type:complete len:265 (+) Transcript_7980:1744-2538(+)
MLLVVSTKPELWRSPVERESELGAEAADAKGGPDEGPREGPNVGPRTSDDSAPDSVGMSEAAGDDVVDDTADEKLVVVGPGDGPMDGPKDAVEVEVEPVVETSVSSIVDVDVVVVVVVKGPREGPTSSPEADEDGPEDGPEEGPVEGAQSSNPALVGSAANLLKSATGRDEATEAGSSMSSDATLAHTSSKTMFGPNSSVDCIRPAEGSRSTTASEAMPQIRHSSAPHNEVEPMLAVKARAAAALAANSGLPLPALTWQESTML